MRVAAQGTLATNIVIVGKSRRTIVLRTAQFIGAHKFEEKNPADSRDRSRLRGYTRLSSSISRSPIFQYVDALSAVKAMHLQTVSHDDARRIQAFRKRKSLLTNCCKTFQITFSRKPLKPRLNPADWSHSSKYSRLLLLAWAFIFSKNLIGKKGVSLCWRIPVIYRVIAF